MKAAYFESIAMIEQLHRLYLEIIKNELNRLNNKDINNVQAWLLYNIGDNEPTIGDLINKGYYLGTNVSYNLKKIVENDYAIQEPSPHDARSSYVRLSPKGKELFKNLDQIIENQANLFHKEVGSKKDIEDFSRGLHRMEIFLSRLLSS
jgi:DNA-binding MarR family transcriptional regulator